jgi:hypothetical protein
LLIVRCCPVLVGFEGGINDQPLHLFIDGGDVIAFAKMSVAAAVVVADLSEQFCSDAAGSARLDCPVSIFVSAPTGMTAQRVRAGMVRQTAVTRT